jgi:hypothetical protein
MCTHIFVCITCDFAYPTGLAVYLMFTQITGVYLNVCITSTTNNFFVR